MSIYDGASMQIFRIIPFVLAAWLLPTLSGYAVDGETTPAGDAAHGEHLAQNWCASCHLVSAEQKSTRKAAAPPFATIAQSSTFNADRLAYLLYDPHPKMAKLVLSRAAIEDIAAYVLSLKK
jgi:mono/diheme cytochrome c family protein